MRLVIMARVDFASGLKPETSNAAAKNPRLATVVALVTMSCAYAVDLTKAANVQNVSSLAAAIDRLADEEIAAKGTVGLTIAIDKGGKTLVAKGYGFADLRTKSVRRLIPSTGSPPTRSNSLPPPSSSYRQRANCASKTAWTRCFPSIRLRRSQSRFAIFCSIHLAFRTIDEIGWRMSRTAT